MKILRVDQEIEVCRIYLATIGSGSQMEIFITRYLQVMICASFEKAVKDIFIEKISKTNKRYLVSFSRECLGIELRNVQTSKIAGTLNKFGDKYGNRFQRKLKESLEAQQSETAFNQIVKERHITAHSSGSAMTFNDLVSAYEKGHIVLDMLRVALLH